MTYSPLKITGMQTGLVQNREEFILPDDAYPVLENAYVWRERIIRKQGTELLGRLRRVLDGSSLGTYSTIVGTNTLNIFTRLGINVTEPNAEIELGNLSNITISFGAPISQVLTNTTGTSVLTIDDLSGPIQSATINYATGVVTITANAIAGPAAVGFLGAYYPGLPVMGLRLRELTSISNEQTIAFDQKYAYNFAGGWEEFIPGTTWTGNDSDFFWTTNYWVGIGNLKIFWVTNFSGQTGDPIRYTNGTAWIDFAPIINAASDVLAQCLALLPFRGRMVAFNTYEGAALSTSVRFTNRIRWAAIGTPFTVTSSVVSAVNATAWRDDIRGQGGFLDIPTSEDIISVGFVRDNLVIYCERSTWQLRYTGRSIAPFQIEKVNSELGAESTFSAIQFDTSLVGIGDKGVVECDSFKSQRIDIKIPDLVFYFQNDNNGTKRVHGVRDFQKRLAYWTYPYQPGDGFSNTYPNRRLVYNYENDSWAIFTDSFTTLGTYQAQISRRWVDSTFSWASAVFPWIDRPALFPSILGGNQQGFVMYLDELETNEESLFIQGITGNTSTPTVVRSPNHNLQRGQIIQISGILAGSSFANLNGGNFYVIPLDINTFQLWVYNPIDEQFDLPQQDPTGTYFGGGVIAIKDNFRVVSKKFNFIDEGQTIQMGFIDILMNATTSGAITLKVYVDYNESEPVNLFPENTIPSPILQQPDTCFNQTVLTSKESTSQSGTKYWHRVYCPTRGAFLTLEWTLSNAQMVGIEQQSDVQIDAQILWLRRAGRQLIQGN